MTMDIDADEIVLTRSDHKEARFPLHYGPERSSLSMIHTTPDFVGLLAVTTAGDEVLFEAPRFDGADQLAGRLTVYLDQNQWSTLANSIHYPEKVTADERDAARHLIELAVSRKIVLPASAAHHHETTKRFNYDKRYRLGLTMLQLSRGWQMRDPLQVRRNELRAAIARSAGRTAAAREADVAVFSLAPNVLYSPLRGPTTLIAPDRFPPEVAFQWQALTEATAHIDVTLDVERIEDGPDTGWVELNQRFCGWLAGESRDRQQKRKSIDALLLADLSREIAEEAAACGATPEQMSQWVLGQFADDLSHMPATGLYREILHDRHLNKTTIWRRNDLTDMMYLSCAAGYAELVVCERHMCSMLSQALNRLGRPTQVYRRLTDAVAALDDALTTKP